MGGVNTRVSSCPLAAAENRPQKPEELAGEHPGKVVNCSRQLLKRSPFGEFEFNSDQVDELKASQSGAETKMSQWFMAMLSSKSSHRCQIYILRLFMFKCVVIHKPK